MNGPRINLRLLSADCRVGCVGDCSGSSVYESVVLRRIAGRSEFFGNAADGIHVTTQGVFQSDIARHDNFSPVGVSVQPKPAVTRGVWRERWCLTI